MSALRRLAGAAPAFAWAGVAALGLLSAAASALEGGGAGGKKRANVDDMDMALLQRNLLKIYVAEKESAVHQEKLAELKIASQFLDPTRATLSGPTPEQLADLKLRQKHIAHYLTTEKTTSVQILHIVDRVLGTDLHLPGEGRPERVILEKYVELCDIPKGTEIAKAAEIISKALGCKVVVEKSDLVNFTVHMYQERTSGQAILNSLCGSLPFEYRIEDGAVHLRHLEFDEGEMDTGLDEEEKRAEEEEKKKKQR
jgi:hypothetical protein